jgi:hypothetical protein
MGFIRPPEIRRLRLLDDFSPLQIEMLQEHFHPRFLVVRGGSYPPSEQRRVAAAIEDLGRTMELVVRDGDDAAYEFRDRARGARLFRRWPESFLRASDGRLVFSAALTEGHEGTIGTLTVLLNGEALLNVEGREIAGRPQHIVTFGPDDLVPGINTFEIRAGYRYRQGAAPNPVGETGVRLAGDLEAYSGQQGAYVALNGDRREIATGEVAVALAVSPQTAAVVAIEAFVEDAFGSDLAEFLAAQPQGTIVALATEGQLPELALERLGLSRDENPRVAIGVTGAAAATSLWSGEAEALVVVGQPERRRVQLRDLEID